MQYATTGEGRKEPLWQDTAEGHDVIAARDCLKDCMKALIPILKEYKFNRPTSGQFSWLVDGLEEFFSSMVRDSIERLEEFDVFEPIFGDRNERTLFVNKTLADLRAIDGGSL